MGEEETKNAAQLADEEVPAGVGDGPDARQAAELQDRGSHAGAAVPCRDQCVRPTLLEQVHGDHDRRILLGFESQSGRLVHLHDLTRRNDFHVGRHRSTGRFSDSLGNADQKNLISWVSACPRQRPGYYFEGRVIAAHRIYCDPDGAITNRANRPHVHRLCRLLRLFLLDLDCGPAGVVAANRAGVM